MMVLEMARRMFGLSGQKKKRLENSDLSFFMIVQPELTGLSKILL